MATVYNAGLATESTRATTYHVFFFIEILHNVLLLRPYSGSYSQGHNLRTQTSSSGTCYQGPASVKNVSLLEFIQEEALRSQSRADVQTYEDGQAGAFSAWKLTRRTLTFLTPGNPSESSIALLLDSKTSSTRKLLALSLL